MQCIDAEYFAMRFHFHDIYSSLYSVSVDIMHTYGNTNVTRQCSHQPGLRFEWDVLAVRIDLSVAYAQYCLCYSGP